ncbi:MAG: DUF2249 domain-containing protein [Candidatus Cohnella colombiensis]|uniref:DUF2249 domain-containing protein n=1 Tax=Candidatus Cohnella colombiensis TaxID=3121368 RepID=A0AA95JBU6_9BACL|nr:MAG: DUF2249 domain-containing protein [Cohnella sp.]
MERQNANVVELDVRPHLRKKLEPFQLIMETVKKLQKDDIFLLHATFKPTPLLGVLKMKGLVGKAEQLGKEHWITTFVSRKNKHWLDDSVVASDSDDEMFDDVAVRASDGGSRLITLDNRGLEPPKPMMRTLAALERCQSGDQVQIHNDRVPLFLIEELNQLGCPFEVEEQPDGSAVVTISKL